MGKPTVSICENKGADQLRSYYKADLAFVFATRIVKFLYFLNQKFPVSSHLLCLYSSGSETTLFGFLMTWLIYSLISIYGKVKGLVHLHYDFCKMSRDARKPVFGVSDQVRHKPVCAVSEYGKKLEISDLGRREIVLSEWRKQRR